MTSDGWINRPTKSFNLGLSNDMERLKIFQKYLLEGNLESVDRYEMAVDFMIAPGEHHHIDYYEVALYQLSSMFSLGLVNIPQQLDTELYLENSEFYDEHIHIREQFIDDVTQEEPSAKVAEEKEDKIMMKIETKHFVNSTDVKHMTTEDKLQLINDTEGQIRHLDNIGVKSKLVAAELKKAVDFLADITELFDRDL